MGTVIQTRCNTDIKFAWNIGKFLITNNEVREFSDDMRSIKELIGCQSRDGTPNHAANVIKTCLE